MTLITLFCSEIGLIADYTFLKVLVSVSGVGGLGLGLGLVSSVGGLGLGCWRSRSWSRLGLKSERLGLVSVLDA